MGIKTTFKNYIEGFPSFFQSMKEIIQPISITRLELVSDTLTGLLKRGGRDIRWRIQIPQTDPLKFKEFEKKGNRLEVQLNCDISGRVDSLDSDELEIDEYKIEIWIRSLERALSYRPDYDSKKICQKLSKNDWKRVLMSFHMDRKSPGAKIFEPIYHLNAGGRLDEQELCWIPRDLEEPRFYFFPLDLILLSEFILLNFQADKYDELRKTPEWRKQIICSQNLYLKPYVYQFWKCLENNNTTLLDQLIKIH